MSLATRRWGRYIYFKYKDQIDAGDINFFLEKDYSEDLTNMSSKKVMEAIDKIMNAIRKIIESIMGVLDKLLNAIFGAIGEFIDGAMDYIDGILKKIFKPAEDCGKALSNSFGAIAEIEQLAQDLAAQKITPEEYESRLQEIRDKAQSAQTEQTS